MKDGILRVRGADGRYITFRFSCEDVEFFNVVHESKVRNSGIKYPWPMPAYPAMDTEFSFKLKADSKFSAEVQERRNNERRKK
jgi:hypothetical protein